MVGRICPPGEDRVKVSENCGRTGCPCEYIPAESINECSSIVEPSCCKKRQKSPNQETGLRNRGRLKVLNDTKLILSD